MLELWFIYRNAPEYLQKRPWVSTETPLSIYRISPEYLQKSPWVSTETPLSIYRNAPEYQVSAQTGQGRMIGKDAATGWYS